MMCLDCLVAMKTTCSHQSLSSSITSDGELEDDISSSRSNGRRHSGRNSGSERSGKRVSQLKDQQSTGRKRAAKLYPLDREAPCEWLGLSSVGGGSYPIIGCLSGNQQARHHGPDKNVSNNESGNVHRICHACHYQWHAANDPTYDWNITNYPGHNPHPHSEKDKQAAVMIYLKYMANKKKIAD